jgi:hypothetical protein
MNISRAIAVLLCLGGAVPVWAGSGDAATSLEEDFQRLQGKWVKQAPGEEWILNFDANPRAFQMAVSGPEPGFATTRTGFLPGVQEDARGRYFELPPSESLPRRIYYRFDQGNLILDITEGPLRGQHTLVREREAAPSHTAWVIGAVVLVIVVLAAAVILFRLRTRKTAEPVSWPPCQ